MKVGEFLELCMRYDEKMNLLNWQIMDRPVSIFRSTFDLNFGVQNRMHTTKIAVISSKMDWISSAKQYESNWYCLNQRLWDVGVRNGDLIEYHDGDQAQIEISLTSRIRKYEVPSFCCGCRLLYKHIWVNFDKTTTKTKTKTLPKKRDKNKDTTKKKKDHTSRQQKEDETIESQAIDTRLLQ